MKQISYTRAAIRALRRMPANTATLIRPKIKAYATDPASQGNNVRSLKGREGDPDPAAGRRLARDHG
ncbi:type II toxin-antitoxin system RelE family toxin [Roseicyclus mahoneyensis]|jgi:mRNA interferase RelE/StbE|uniref:Uncharacterized protein n=1 Tax=Roseicyclus mahoneyensis TaxID=164332 RepID=A0A316GSK7_9RHOB|nr:hypothetical protein [Roseicyclus mahoneyensis]PWK58017.1 hypothetical protein C7455_11167 [Roseicyclus mahoneyensis]